MKVKLWLSSKFVLRSKFEGCRQSMGNFFIRIRDTGMEMVPETIKEEKNV